MARIQTRYDIRATVYDKKGRVLSRGRNSYVKTHPVQKQLADKYEDGTRMFLHAEVHALLRLKRNSKPHKIFVARYDNEGNHRNAKPCVMCENFIKSTGIREITYT